MSAFVINRKVRLRIGFLFGIAYLVFAKPTPGSLLLGLPVAFIGLLIRAWAAGHIVKLEQLNPLRTFTSLDLWGGVAAAVLILAGAVWLRRRSETL